jgi:uncharacterized protein
MILDNEFRVSVPIERAWEVLTDIPLITPCLPGAELTGHEDDEFTGKIKIKVGPVTSHFAGKALLTVRDEQARHVEIQADGRDSKGSGNASAKITADMSEDGEGTKVTIHTDLKISGKVAQFGKGMIAEVSGKLIGQFVDCIENRLLGDGVIDDVAAQSAATSVAGTPDAATAEAQNSAPEPVEALDLMELAGNSVYKRLAPVGAVIVLLILAGFLFRRRS